MGKRILVADQDSVVQQVVSYFLKLEGFDVEAVGDGVSAMEAIEKREPDVILLTSLLPGINGVEVSHFVRESPKYKTIPIIFLAEGEDPLLNSIPDLSRRFGVVNKPIDPTKLVNTLKEYVERSPVPAEEVAESLKNIEELLGWEVTEKKMQRQEEVIEEKPREMSFDVTELLSCGVPKEDENQFSGSQGVEILNPVQNEGEEGIACEAVAGWAAPTAKVEDGGQCPSDAGFSDVPHESVLSEFNEAENMEADLKGRVTDEMIENMVRKIAADIVERVTREIVPDIAEREIKKEIERLKGTE